MNDDILAVARLIWREVNWRGRAVIVAALVVIAILFGLTAYTFFWALLS